MHPLRRLRLALCKKGVDEDGMGKAWVRQRTLGPPAAAFRAQANAGPLGRACVRQRTDPDLGGPLGCGPLLEIHMNRTALLAAIAVLVTSLGAPVVAKDRNDRDDRSDRDNRGRSSQGHSGRSNEHDQRAQRSHQRQPQAPQRQYERSYQPDYQREYQRNPGERGAGPNHNFYRGARLPTRDHNRYAVVDDWRGHRLNQPPRGYHWVQTGGDYVLVAIATGIILQLMLNN